MSQDDQHLRLLALGYWIIGGLMFLGWLMNFLVLLLLAILPNGPGEVILVLLPINLLFLIFVISLLGAGFLIHRRRGYWFCLVVAAVACGAIPVGTVIGVYTFLVLLRPSVKEQFGIVARR